MKTTLRAGLLPVLLGCLVLPSRVAQAQTTPAKAMQSAKARARSVTAPRDFFGFDIGDDYCLATYRQLKAYWERLAGESDRIKLVSLGLTEEGRPQLSAIVTSPA